MKLKPDALKMVEVEGIKFFIGPETLTDFMAAEMKIRSIGGDQKTLPVATVAYSILERCKEWEGIEDQNGDPAPCNARTKDILFGMRPDLFWEIARKLREDDEAAGKNSESSPGGSGANIQDSAEIAVE